jgi:hypothetical protein
MYAKVSGSKIARERAGPRARLDLPVSGCATEDSFDSARRPPSIPFGPILATLTLTAALISSPGLGVAQSPKPDGAAAARSGAIEHAQKMRRLFPDIGSDAQATPAVIPQLQIDHDPGGAIATFQPSGPTMTAKNAFFQNLGTNGRTCFTCHRPEDAWSLSAQHARDRFHANPDDPLFRLVDGATCPSDDISTLPANIRLTVCCWRKV